MNRAEISSATGGMMIVHQMALSAMITPLIQDPDDNNVDGNGPSQGEDEDDLCGPQIVDIALAKPLSRSAGPYSYGQNIVFNVAVTNQGSVALQNVDVTDYIPCGFTYVTGSQPDIVSSNAGDKNRRSIGSWKSYCKFNTPLDCSRVRQQMRG
ncbi:MAG: hypothetical protein U0T36_03680 [Saprospiraceae bacterium]